MNDFNVANLPIANKNNDIKQIFVANKLLSVYPLMNMDISDSIEDNIFLIERLSVDIFIDKEFKVYKVDCEMKNFLPYHLTTMNCDICGEQLRMLDEDMIACEKCEELTIV